MKLQHFALGVTLAVSLTSCKSPQKTNEEIIADTRCNAVAQLDGIKGRGGFYITDTGENILFAQRDVISGSVQPVTIGDNTLLESIDGVLENGDTCKTNGFGGGHAVTLKPLSRSEEFAARIREQ